jgi:nitroimidazol reductase NimA-like FMN-containing flavoprotein (pyridoxamine 5'-phosphate oxidase superfamily)
MPVLTGEERNAFLDEREVVMKIAVAREDGSPLVTPIWFQYEDGAIYFTPRARSEWFGCLRRDARVALCIDESSLPYRKVLVEGNAEMVHDVGADDEWRDRYRQIACRYLPGEFAEAYVQGTIDEPRGLFRIELADAKVRSWRMPVGDEAPEGIWHERYYQDPKTRF